MGGIETALMPRKEMALIPSLTPSNVIPSYSTSKETRARDKGRTKGTDGWWHTHQKLLVPLSEQWKIIKGLPDSLHLGRDLECLPKVVLDN